MNLNDGTDDDQPSTIPIQRGTVFATGYSPQLNGDNTEGDYKSSIAGPDGAPLVRTLEDVRNGTSPYVTLAGNPLLYGKTYTLPSVTYQANGKTYTLKNVQGVVHDTGPAFKTAPEGRFDIAVGRDLNMKERNQDMSAARFVPTNASAYMPTQSTPSSDPFGDYGVPAQKPVAASPITPADPFADYGVKAVQSPSVAPASPPQPAAVQTGPSDPFTDYAQPSTAPLSARMAGAVPGPNGLLWNSIGGFDPKTGELVIAGKPPTTNAPSQGLAADASFVNGIPLVGQALVNGAVNTGAWVRNKLYGDPADQVVDAVHHQIDASNAAHPKTALASNVAGGIVGTAPAVAYAPAAFGISKAPLAVNALSSAATGTALNAADTAIRGGTPQEIAENAGLGAGFGFASPIAGRLIGGVSNLLGNATIGSLDHETALLADLARTKYGIPVTAPQMSDGNNLTKFASSALDKLPFSGAGSTTAAIQKGVNSAVAKEFGEAADKITPDVMNAARTRIGADFDKVAANTTLKVDSQFAGDFSNAINTADLTLTKPEADVVKKIATNIFNKIDPATGQMTGDVYQAITRKGTPLDRLIDSDNPNIAHAAQGIRNSLDGMLQRSAPSDMQDLLATARKQWAAMKTIQPLAAKAPTGDINPALLAGAVNKSTGNGMAFGWGGGLGDIARIGQRFLKQPPSSGTAERSLVYGALGLPAAALGAHELGLGPDLGPGATTAAMTIPAALLAGRFAGSALRSPTLANALVSRSLAPVAASAKPSAMVTNLLTRQLGQSLGPNMLSGDQ